jgi:hypothetical protein
MTSRRALREIMMAMPRVADQFQSKPGALLVIHEHDLALVATELALGQWDCEAVTAFIAKSLEPVRPQRVRNLDSDS